ncbi:MAG: uroporphyrinogen decarboxylase family protein [Kiritimatiellae bacterium]|nr:uroporphyrinogen decarboxylase family protein [Kiritimatiellia bacterium]
MKTDMRQWAARVIETRERQSLPILSAPGIPLLGRSAAEVHHSGQLQFEAIQAIARRYPTAAAVMMMDLSVEAEAFGAPVNFEAQAVPTVSGRAVQDAAGIEALAVPSLAAGRVPEALRCAELCAAAISDRPMLGGMIGPFSLACRLADTTEMMVMTALDPVPAHHLLEKATAYLLAYARALKASGVSGLLIAEPAAGVISPEMNVEFAVRYVREIVRAVQDDGFMVVLHNCGKTVKQIADWLSTGVMALHVGNAVRMTEILPQVPRRILVAGNLDPSGLFKNGTPAMVRAATRELLESMAGFPNFVISSGCDIPQASPLANIDAFFDTIREYNGR